MEKVEKVSFVIYFSIENIKAQCERWESRLNEYLTAFRQKYGKIQCRLEYMTLRLDWEEENFYW